MVLFISSLNPHLLCGTKFLVPLQHPRFKNTKISSSLVSWEQGELNMGLSSFPSPTEGMLPLLVMNTVISVALVKNLLRSLLQVVGANGGGGGEEQDFDEDDSRTRRVSITRYGSLCRNTSDGGRRGCRDDCGCSGSGGNMECCVCLCRFEGDEEVSELLSCKHFFHKGCLEKWFDNQHTTCPLCRSTM